MSTFTKRILFAAATTGMVLAGVGAIDNLALGTAAFAKETEHADHERGGKSDTGADKASHDRNAEKSSSEKGGNDSADPSGDR
jgi:hypothetical protein